MIKYKLTFDFFGRTVEETLFAFKNQLPEKIKVGAVLPSPLGQMKVLEVGQDQEGAAFVAEVLPN